MPTQVFVHVNDIDLALTEWIGEDPPVLFLHAAGFHGRIWDQVISRLEDIHCFALDLRGHGRSSSTTVAPEWHTFASDVIAVGDHFHWSGVVGVGHSIGGHALTAAAAARPGMFSRLLLIDPTIMPEVYYVGVMDFDHYTRKRRREWASPDEMFERFRSRAPFDQWNPDVLRDYVTYGLVLNPSGSGYMLACDPDFEADTYNYGTAANIYPLIPSVSIPVTVMRAAGQQESGVFNLSASPTVPDLAARFPNGRDIYLPQYSHFIPMEAPEVIAEAVRDIHPSK